jgi:hypothetical protein
MHGDKTRELKSQSTRTFTAVRNSDHNNLIRDAYQLSGCQCSVSLLLSSPKLIIGFLLDMFLAATLKLVCRILF